jgi:hypothetical protein
VGVLSVLAKVKNGPRTDCVNGLIEGTVGGVARVQAEGFGVGCQQVVGPPRQPVDPLAHLRHFAAVTARGNKYNFNKHKCYGIIDLHNYKDRPVRLHKICAQPVFLGIKETVSSDFRLLVFFINQLPLGPWLIP